MWKESVFALFLHAWKNFSLKIVKTVERGPKESYKKCRGSPFISLVVSFLIETSHAHKLRLWIIGSFVILWIGRCLDLSRLFLPCFASSYLCKRLGNKRSLWKKRKFQLLIKELTSKGGKTWVLEVSLFLLL